MSEQSWCSLCAEPMGGELSSSAIQQIHHACSYRSVAGGIGHHLDHAHFCITKRDPDAGVSFRTSALLVWELVHRADYQRNQPPHGEGT